MHSNGVTFDVVPSVPLLFSFRQIAPSMSPDEPAMSGLEQHRTDAEMAP
jgi:hypothetical protein